MAKIPRLALILATFLASTTITYAQIIATDNRAVQNPSATSPDHARHEQLSHGHNSFTQRQARARMQRAGYQQVSDLVLDPAGLWQAHALWRGTPVQVALDYKGHVAAQ